jgi:hypothetical protein
MINHHRNFQLHKKTRGTIHVIEFSKNLLEAESLYVTAVGSSPNKLVAFVIKTTNVWSE